VAIGHIDERSPRAALRTVPLETMRVAMDEETESAGKKARPALKGLTGRTNSFASEVYAAVRSGKLAQPFSAETVRIACPGYTEGTYRNFFKRHRVGNPSGMAELFLRRAWNRFETIDSDRTDRRPQLPPT
jgi:hypothetical protein